MKILIINTTSDYIFGTFFTPDNMEFAKKHANVVECIYDENDRSELIREIADADAVITFWGITPDKFDEELIGCANKLKIVAHCGGSAFPVLSDSVKNRGIKVLSGNKFFAHSVAEGTLAYILLGQRKLYPILKDMENEGWADYVPTEGLRYKTVGIYGFGMIAKYLSGMLKAFGADVIVSAEYDIPKEEQEKYGVRQCSIEELFKTADVVSINAGLNETNYHIVDKKLLSLMKDDALIVNTSRGAVINESDLEDEVSGGRIRAVLDVYEVQPLPENSRLRGLDNVTLVPYRGGPTTDLRKFVVRGLLEDIINYFEGDGTCENEMNYEYIKYQTDESLKVKAAKEKMDK